MLGYTRRLPKKMWNEVWVGFFSPPSQHQPDMAVSARLSDVWSDDEEASAPAPGRTPPPPRSVTQGEAERDSLRREVERLRALLVETRSDLRRHYAALWATSFLALAYLMHRLQRSTRSLPSHPLPSYSLPSHPLPSYSLPSHPLPSYPLPSHPLPFDTYLPSHPYRSASYHHPYFYPCPEHVRPPWS